MMKDLCAKVVCECVGLEESGSLIEIVTDGGWLPLSPFQSPS